MAGKLKKERADIAELDLASLVSQLKAAKQEALNLRFRNATGQLEDHRLWRAFLVVMALKNTHILTRDFAAAEAGV